MEPPAHQQNNHEKQGFSFVSNHAMRMRLEGDLSVQELQNALDGIRQRHTLLIPGGEDSHFSLEERTNCTEADWMEAARQELLKPFPQAGPFARFILIRSAIDADLLAVFHHGICDGMSGVYVMRDILRVLGQPGLVPEPIPEPGHMFTLIPSAVSESRLLRLQAFGFVCMLRLNLFFEQLFPARGQQPVQGSSHPDPSSGSRSMIILIERLTREQTSALVQRCKRERTSVHAAICTAILRAFTSQPEAGWSNIRSASSPVSLRERLSIPDTSGLFLANLVTKLNCAPARDFWETTREFKRKLSRKVSDVDLFRFPMLIGAVFSKIPAKDIPLVLPKLFNRPVRYDFSVTNLGRLDLPARSGRVQVQAFTNLVNSSEHERTVCVNTFDGRLTYSLLYRASKMDARQGQELMRTVSAELERAIGGQSREPAGDRAIR